MLPINKKKQLKQFKKNQSILKEKIKREQNKRKLIEKTIHTKKTDIESYTKIVKRIRGNIKRTQKMICTDCAECFQSKNEYNNHWCCPPEPTCHMWDNYHKELWEALRSISQFEADITELSEKDDVIKNNLRTFKTDLQDITTMIRDLAMECKNCNQSIPGLINCGCSFNHRFCEDCCANLNDSCSTCGEHIEVEMCEICMKYSTNHTIMNCGNEHQICTACFTHIRDTTATCPFCRKTIS